MNAGLDPEILVLVLQALLEFLNLPDLCAKPLFHLLALGDIPGDAQKIRLAARDRSNHASFGNQPSRAVARTGNPKLGMQNSVAIVTLQSSFDLPENGIPILGVCLGHQSIGYAFGGKIIKSATLMHGKTSPILHDGKGLFEGLPNPFAATRYHSLIVERGSLPEELVVTAWVAQGEIMGMRHRTLPIWGVQFHPESILTEGGMDLLRNFLEMSK